MKELFSPKGLLVVAVLFLSVHMLASLSMKSARIDLTEGSLYTLTDGSRNILAQIDEPLTLKLFYSSELLGEVPILATYGRRVRELLEEFALVAGENLRLSVVEPEPFSDAEDEAVQGGLRGIPVNNAGDLAYFGLVAASATDQKAVIPFFDPSNEKFLEYDLARLVYRLGNAAKTRVGILSSLPIMGTPPARFPGAPPPQEPWFLVEQLRETFEVEELDPGSGQVPPGIDVLLVIHPKGFSDAMLFAIDQFVLGGGKALVCVDPHSEEDQPPRDPSNPMAGMGTPRNSDLGPLLAAWGVTLEPEMVLGDRAAALAVNSGSAGRAEPVDYIVWLGLDGECIDASDPVTADLNVLRMPAVGILRPVDGATTTLTPLVRSSAQSMEIGADKLQFFPDPKALLNDFRPSGKQQIIAARLLGPAKTAYPDGPPEGVELPGSDEPEGDADGDGQPDDAGDGQPDAAGADADGDGQPDDPGADADGDGTPDDPAAGAGDAAAEPDYRRESEQPIHVIVVADADFLADRWWVEFANLLGMRIPRLSADNASFALNALDSLSGSTDLVSVRSRGNFQRRFEVMDELKNQAEQRFLAEEQALNDELAATQRRLDELDSQRAEGSSAFLTAEQQQEIETFLEKKVETRKKLRAVRHALGKDMESLQGWLKFGNIFGVPLLLTAFALLRSRRR